MKAKLKVFSLVSLASVSSMAVLAVNSLANGGSMKMKAGESNERSFTITADAIREALGEDGSATSRKAANFYVNGMEFAINNAYYADGKINVSGGALYNVTLAGSSVGENKVVGTGFKKVVINGYDSKTGANSFFKNDKLATIEEHPLGAVNENQTINLDKASEKAARFEFSFGAGDGTYFTSVTYTYTCGYATPTIDEITGDASSIDVGGKANLVANTSYATEAATFTWESSSDAIATVSGTGATAEVTGVAGGDATITCTLTDGTYTSSATYEVKVNAASAKQEALIVLDTCSVQGAGVFVRFNPTANGMAFGDNIVAYCNELETSAKVIEGTQKVNSSHFQEQSATSTTFYVTLDSAAVSGNFALAVSFKDTTNNVVYAANVYFKDGQIAPSLTLSGAAKVVVGNTVELIAEKGYFLTGDATYSFASDNTDVATVTSSDNVATVKGVKAGTANITVTMTLDGKTYTSTKAIAVTAEATAATALTPSSGEINGAQFWLRGIDNTKLGVTGENLTQITTKASVTVTYNGDGDVPDAYAPHVGENKITPNSYTYEDINSDTVTLYVPISVGLDASWDITWNIHVDITNANGDEFTIDCRFVKTTFAPGASD